MAVTLDHPGTRVRRCSTTVLPNNSRRTFNPNTKKMTVFGVCNMPILVAFVLMISIWTIQIQPAESFAAWLKCYVDLEDPDEIIMNYSILSPDNAPHEVRIQVRPMGSTSEQQDWITGSWIYPANQKTTLEARLLVTDALAGIDVQYVMETTVGATFSSPIMCGGSRSHARNYKEAVTLEINGEQDKIDLMAAWATGHEPVSRTHRFHLRKEGYEEEEEL